MISLNNKIIELYKDYKSISKVCKKLDLSYRYIRKQLLESGIKLQPRGGQRKFKCNEYFFKQDTPESFYWAGFIAADGCVANKYKNTKILTLDISTSDIKHLYKFKKTIDFTGNILTYDRGTFISSKIIINSYRLVSSLEKLNIVPRKSLTYTFPEWLIEHPLVNHFMRGYFDGDGCFYTRKHKTYQVRGSVVGTYEFLNTYQKILIKNCIMGKNKISQDGKIFKLGLHGNKIVKKFRDFIYKNKKDILLDRKFNIVKTLR